MSSDVKERDFFKVSGRGYLKLRDLEKEGLLLREDRLLLDPFSQDAQALFERGASLTSRSKSFQSFLNSSLSELETSGLDEGVDRRELVPYLELTTVPEKGESETYRLYFFYTEMEAYSYRGREHFSDSGVAALLPLDLLGLQVLPGATLLKALPEIEEDSPSQFGVYRQNEEEEVRLIF